MELLSERISKKLVEKLEGVLKPSPEQNAQDLLTCWLSGQMSEKQWLGHLEENPVLRKLKENYYSAPDWPEPENYYSAPEPESIVEYSKGDNTMKTTFEEIIEVVLAHEGGFVDDPDDRGGATNWGVTQAVWEDHLEDEFTSEDVRNFTREQAIALYKEEFWIPSQSEKLPEEIREIYFDMCVNHGQRNAVKILQTAVNAKGGNIDVDGAIGPNTIREASKLKLWEVQVERSGFYWNLVFVGSFYGKRNSQQKFIRGWIRRCFNLG